MIYLKNPKQIIGISKSCVLAARTLKHIAPLVKAGVTTGHLNDEAEKFIRDNGAIPAPLGYRGFPKAICVSVNEVICHGIPGDYALKDGDILNVDVTTILNGYYGDTSTMFAVGEISAEAKKLLEVTKRCLQIGIQEVKPGRHLGNVGYAINKHAQENGCSVVTQFCGHGTGLRFHEEPNVLHTAPYNSGPKLRKGMTFTIEPMLNLGGPEAVISEADGWTATTVDGSLSAQYEHTVLVTQNGVEVLTKE